ncbi:MAG: hypothetical protein QS748_01895 [Candidatus Endonucleobacter bathymodioli]|uniref:Uncharacterized protein n=1 Tax=Candidatus Endonucleibacter bathymodioli TaxID=539814 RepID=A0AA90NRM7_9GAMM|nr:hypothetical protein [Candidatus Endonucleobacter bathymodioli]
MNTQLAVFRLPSGVFPESVIAQAKVLKAGFSKACTMPKKASKDLNSAIDRNILGSNRKTADQFYP